MNSKPTTPATCPEDRILYCPHCGVQHIDAANPDICEDCGYPEDNHGNDTFNCPKFNPWMNPPHKKHRCKIEDGGCNEIFKPEDYPTNGVKELTTTTPADGLKACPKCLTGAVTLRFMRTGPNDWKESPECTNCGRLHGYDVIFNPRDIARDIWNGRPQSPPDSRPQAPTAGEREIFREPRGYLMQTAQLEFSTTFEDLSASKRDQVWQFVRDRFEEYDLRYMPEGGLSAYNRAEELSMGFTPPRPSGGGFEERAVAMQNEWFAEVPQCRIYELMIRFHLSELSRPEVSEGGDVEARAIAFLKDRTLYTDPAPLYVEFARQEVEIATTSLRALIETLRREAEIHAQEARAANATIAEIYQVVTGSTGEPGNWNGAKPVKDAFDSLRAALEKAQEWRLAVEARTPQGSEYHNDLARCLEYIDQRLVEGYNAKKDAVKLRRSLEEAEGERDSAREMYEHCHELRFSPDTDWHGIVIQTDTETGLSRFLDEDTDGTQSLWNGEWYESQLDAFKVMKLEGRPAPQEDGEGRGK